MGTFEIGLNDFFHHDLATSLLGLECDGLDKNGPHGLICLSIWSPGSETERITRVRTGDIESVTGSEPWGFNLSLFLFLSLSLSGSEYNSQVAMLPTMMMG